MTTSALPAILASLSSDERQKLDADLAYSLACAKQDIEVAEERLAELRKAVAMNTKMMGLLPAGVNDIRRRQCEARVREAQAEMGTWETLVRVTKELLEDHASV